MKPARVALITLGVLVLLGLVTVGLAFNSGVQTWAARKALAGQPSVRVTLDSVSAGFSRVELRGLRAELSGAVVTVPSLTVELSVMAAGLSQKVSIGKLVARGWTFDLTKGPASSPSAAGSKAGAVSTLGNAGPVPVSAGPGLPASVGRAFEGVLAELKLPVDLAIDGLVLEGEVLLPPAPGDGPAALRCTHVLRGSTPVTFRLLDAEGRTILRQSSVFLGPDR
jgi:hypothetical protein